MNPHFGKVGFFGELGITIIGIVCLIYLVGCVVSKVITFVKRKKGE